MPSSPRRSRSSWLRWTTGPAPRRCTGPHVRARALAARLFTRTPRSLEKPIARDRAAMNVARYTEMRTGCPACMRVCSLLSARARTHTRAHMPDGFMTRGGRLWERVHRAGAAHRRSQGRPAQCSRRFDGRAPGRPVRTFFLSLGADARPYASLSHTLTHPSHTSC